MKQSIKVKFLEFHPKYSPIITELLTVTFSQFQKASLESSLEL